MADRVLIAGCGDVGCALGSRLVAAGHEVWGLRRQIDALPPEIRPLAGDLTRDDDFPGLPTELDVVIYAAAAERSDEENYRAIYVEGLRRVLKRLTASGQQLRRVLFTSSTAVYAQHDGEEIDETSPAEPRGFRGELMLAAEEVLHASPHPSIVIRFGGIYGPGRTRLIRRTLSGEPWQKAPPLYTNRIHVEDCARAIEHLLQLENPQPLYLGVDRRSVPLDEVMSWICEQLSQPVPQGEAESGPRGAGKRISSQRLRQSGFVLQYPSYREGYREMIASFRAQS